MNLKENLITFDVCERFVSINGEGRRAGQLSVFMRFKGCNLSCSYCDTMWANSDEASFEVMTTAEILDYIKGTSVKNVTLTGGEPLLRDDISDLLKCLKENGLRVEIETNGSVDIRKFCDSDVRPDCFTMDYKLQSSGMEDYMLLDNFSCLNKNDCVKFVVGSHDDLLRALEVINEYNFKCSVYLSPVFGLIEPCEIVDFMIQNGLNDVNLQIQMHKVIWDPSERGV